MNARHLTVEQLCKAKTLYKSVLDSKLKKEVKEKCPQLLEEPKDNRGMRDSEAEN